MYVDERFTHSHQHYEMVIKFIRAKNEFNDLLKTITISEFHKS